MKKVVPKIVIVLILIVQIQNINLGVGNSSIPTINVNPSHYSLGVTPGDVQLYEITSLQILLPDGNITDENTTNVMVGGQMIPLTLKLHDKIQIGVASINSTNILSTKQFQLTNGSTIIADPFYQNLDEFSFDSYIMTTNSTLIEEIIDQSNLYATTLTSSTAYFENMTLISEVSGLTSVWGTRYEFPSGWLKSIILETFNDTHHPPYLSYYELEQYVEPEPANPFEVNPDFYTLGVAVGDEQVLEIVKVITPEPEMELQEGYQYKLKVLSITSSMVLLSTQTVDKFGNIIDDLEYEVNRSHLTPLGFILTTNITLIHEVFDTDPDFHVIYTNELVTFNFSISILSDSISIEMIFDLQTGWIVNYHIKMGTGADLTEILMVAESALTTTTSTTSTTQMTTDDPDSNTSTTTTTNPKISPFPGFLMILLSTLVLLVGRKWRK